MARTKVSKCVTLQKQTLLLTHCTAPGLPPQLWGNSGATGLLPKSDFSVGRIICVRKPVRDVLGVRIPTERFSCRRGRLICVRQLIQAKRKTQLLVIYLHTSLTREAL